MQKLKRLWEWSGKEVLVGRRWILAVVLAQSYVFVCFSLYLWGRARAPERDDLAILKTHERLVSVLWPNGFKKFVPVPAIVFTHPPNGSLGEHVCTTQGCGAWSIDSEWACRVDGGKWDGEGWRCARP